MAERIASMFGLGHFARGEGVGGVGCIPVSASSVFFWISPLVRSSDPAYISSSDISCTPTSSISLDIDTVLLLNTVLVVFSVLLMEPVSAGSPFGCQPIWLSGSISKSPFWGLGSVSRKYSIFQLHSFLREIYQTLSNSRSHASVDFSQSLASADILSAEKSHPSGFDQR